MTKKLKIKGREFKLDADDEVVKAQDAVGELEAAQESELAAVKAALMEALKKVASLEAKIAAEEAAEAKPVTEDMVPEDVADAIAAKRGALRERARKVLGVEFKLDGMKAHEIHKAVVAKALPSVKLDSLDAKTVEGMFVAACEGAATTARADSLRAAHPGAPVTERNDGDETLSPAAALNRRTHNHFDNRGAAAERA